MRLKFAISAALMLSACEGDGAENLLRGYHASVQPLMYKNEDLADRFIELAGTIQLEDTPGEEVANIFERDLIPLAEELSTSAQAIVLEGNEVGKIHGLLVNAWTLRASAYNKMLEAYRNSDTSIFDSAEETNNTSKQSEETYFGEINRYFSTVNLKLIQFPRGG